ncbi:MAG: metallophosphoesterase [Simkaniaceae bacterium]|nr:metallophosphoesterase [Simkaniaceae bacterium]MCF7852112.1 metallophosphoesterase [Simkaniaceae bacterium]
MRIIHISDLHFGFPCYSPSQFFSKRMIGNANFLWRRRKIHSHRLIEAFLEQVDDFKGDVVMISGDFTTTAQKREFKEGIRFIQSLQSKGLKVFAIPGNHDAYTSSAYQNQDFYRYFAPYLPFEGWPGFHLKQHSVAHFTLSETLPHEKSGLGVILLDCSTNTNYFSSTGRMTEKIAINLQQLLSEIPKNQPILLMGHYPFFKNEHPKRQLKQADLLRKIIISSPQIRLYLHGHTHRHAIADLRENAFPLISDAGSISVKKRGTFNIIDCSDEAIHMTVHRFDQQWNVESRHAFKPLT